MSGDCGSANYVENADRLQEAYRRLHELEHESRRLSSAQELEALEQEIRVLTDELASLLVEKHLQASLDESEQRDQVIELIKGFAIGRGLKNLPALREIGFNANRRLLEVEKISQDCQLGNETFEQVNRPQVVDGQRASALGFGDERVMALFQALCVFMLLPQGFRNAHLRDHVAQLLGFSSEAYSPGRMTYDLRRLRLHGIIAREAGTHRYHVTPEGMRICLFMTKVHHRILRPGLSQIMDGCPQAPRRPVASAMKQLDHAIDQMVLEAKIAA